MKGLNSFTPNNWPPVAEVFWSFRFMAIIGAWLLCVAIWATWQRKRQPPSPALLKTLVWNIPIPYVSIMLGWTVAEMGRQPWIVYGLMRTSDAVSYVPPSSVTLSLIAFTLIYTILGVLDIYLLRKHAINGPKEA